MSSAISDNNNNQSGDINNKNNQLNYQTNVNNNITGSLSTLYNDPSDNNLKAHSTFLKVQHPELSNQIDSVTSSLSKMPEDARKGAIATMINQQQSPGQQQVNTVGSPVTIDDGSQISGGTQNGMTGELSRTGNSISKQLSPESNASIMHKTVVGPDGRVHEVYDTAGNIRNNINNSGANLNGYTGRRVVNLTGNTNSQQPTYVDASAPTGTIEQYNTGRDIKNNLNMNQSDITNNLSSLRNLDSLLSKIPADARSRRLAELQNNLSKWGLTDGKYATLAQEIDKAGTQVRHNLMAQGSGPHTNAGLSDLEHLSPSIDMTPTAARALTNEMITASEYGQKRNQLANSVSDLSQLPQILSQYDNSYEPRYFTISRLGPEEGKQYANTHISDRNDYINRVRNMARLQKSGKFDFGLPANVVNNLTR